MFALRIGVPSDWGQTVEEISKAAHKLAEQLRQRLKRHRRGFYRTVTTGFSYGNGQTVGGFLLFILAGCDD